MEHSELVQEMAVLEKLTAQERLKNAKRRRQQQLIDCIRRDDPADAHTIDNKLTSTSSKNSHVQFPESIILLDATTRQDLDEVRSLLESGKYHPNAANEDGLTAIHQCSIDNSDQLLRLIIEFGGDVNAKDRDLWTPLHAAATCGHAEICKILVDHGADLLTLNIDGNMAYDICEDETTLDYIETEMDRIGITQDMIDQTRSHIEHQMLSDLQNLVETNPLSSRHSIDGILSYRNEDGATPLHIASANGYQTVVDYLLQQHVTINHRDTDGWAPIHAATFWCQQPILTQLIQAGADIYDKLPNGRSALDLCDDPDLRVYMIDVREQCIRNREEAAAATAQSQAKIETTTLINTRLQVDINSSLSNATPSRTGTLYESRSSISSPYSSGSSLNRSNSIRRASIRDREKAKKLNENFLDVLKAKDQIHEDIDETTHNNGVLPLKKLDKDGLTHSVPTMDAKLHEPLTNPTPTKPTNTPINELPAVVFQTTVDTSSDVKRRREERRREISTGPFIPMSSQSIVTKDIPDTKPTNGNHRATISDSERKHSAENFFELNDHVRNDDREKRICCTIL